jgi:UDPglucose 6-dehydrogenase
MTATPHPPHPLDVGPALRVAVAGLWHLGTVTAACLASRGIDTVGYDADTATVAALQAGTPPVFEPGLEALAREGLSRGSLRFTANPADTAVADVLWVTWDTPVDDEDRADVAFVVAEVTRLFPHLKDDALVLVSSQLPVGTTRELEAVFARLRPEAQVSFACCPENLRLGKAIEVFTSPDRVVVGVRSTRDADRLKALLAPFTANVEVVRVESAELTKHALNAYLATSVAFINEIARIAELVGADTREVERGLKSDIRIGPRAYVKPGGAYAGGTLARDIAYLIERGAALGRPMDLVRGVRASNDAHRDWAFDTVARLLGSLDGRTIAVLGLTYKPGTDTVRRSSAVELCRRLVDAGAMVVAHDPRVHALPPEVAAGIRLVDRPSQALAAADAVVIATEWPEFRALTADDVAVGRAATAVVDASGFLAPALAADPRLRYAMVGTVS